MYQQLTLEAVAERLANGVDTGYGPWGNLGLLVGALEDVKSLVGGDGVDLDVKADGVLLLVERLTELGDEVICGIDIGEVDNHLCEADATNIVDDTVIGLNVLSRMLADICAQCPDGIDHVQHVIPSDVEGVVSHCVFRPDVARDRFAVPVLRDCFCTMPACLEVRLW